MAALPASASVRIADDAGSAGGVASEGGVGSIAASGGAVDGGTGARAAFVASANAREAGAVAVALSESTLGVCGVGSAGVGSADDVGSADGVASAEGVGNVSSVGGIAMPGVAVGGGTAPASAKYVGSVVAPKAALARGIESADGIRSTRGVESSDGVESAVGVGAPGVAIGSGVAAGAALVVPTTRARIDRGRGGVRGAGGLSHQRVRCWRPEELVLGLKLQKNPFLERVMVAMNNGSHIIITSSEVSSLNLIIIFGSHGNGPTKGTRPSPTPTAAPARPNLNTAPFVATESREGARARKRTEMETTDDTAVT